MTTVRHPDQGGTCVKPDAAGGPKRAKRGEMCGGFAGIRCEDGLHCKMPVPAAPDQAGVCFKPL